MERRPLDASIYRWLTVHANPDEALGPRRKPVSAWPAAQDYRWSHSGYDWSIDTSVNVTLLSHWLMDGASLRLHPSRPFWYDANGTLQAQHRTHT